VNSVVIVKSLCRRVYSISLFFKVIKAHGLPDTDKRRDYKGTDVVVQDHFER